MKKIINIKEVIRGVIYGIIAIIILLFFLVFYMVFLFAIPFVILLIAPAMLLLSIIWANLPIKRYKRSRVRIFGYCFVFLMLLMFLVSLWNLYTSFRCTGECYLSFLFLGIPSFFGIASSVLSSYFLYRIIVKSRKALKEIKEGESLVK